MQLPNLLFSDCCQPNSSGSIEQALHCLSQLRQAGDDDDDVAVSTYPESLAFHEIRQVVGAAFGGKTVEQGNAIMMYVLKALDLDDDDDSDHESTAAKDRQDVSGFCMGFFAYETLQKNGLAFGLRDKKSGDVKAVAVFREYQPARENKKPGVLAKITEFITMMTAYFKMKSDPVGLPKILNDTTQRKKFEESSQAVQPMMDMLHEWHCQYAPQENHFYIALVATDPNCQGKGYGKKLMNILNGVADECGMACYLESPSVNQMFYEKMGYQKSQNPLP